MNARPESLEREVTIDLRVASVIQGMLSLNMTTFGGHFSFLGGKELSKQVLIFNEARVSTHLMLASTNKSTVGNIFK